MFASYANLSRDRCDWLALSHGLAMLDEEGDLARKVTHTFRKIRDLRGDNQDSWIFHLLLTMLYWYIPVLLQTLYQKHEKSGTGKK